MACRFTTTQVFVRFREAALSLCNPLITAALLAATAALLFVPLGVSATTKPAVIPDVPRVVKVWSGSFIMGSDRTEREAAYRLDELAYGHRVTREQRWYESEPDRREQNIGAFFVTATAVTNHQYQAFVRATGRAAPDVDARTWVGYRLIHKYPATRRFAWTDGRPPAGREDHPVVLVSHADAKAYAVWLTQRTGSLWRLPTEAEWEKAARGEDGSAYPWGNRFNPAFLNSADQGPFDTLPVGSFPEGASPYGVLDAVGQVFEWTATRSGRGRYIVKGGSWDDKGCGVCRPAARHSRPADIKHILIGFRLIRE